jgi:hypothetical protein
VSKILKLMVPAIVMFAGLASAMGAYAHSIGGGGTPGPNNLFITSAVEHPDGTVTLPLHRGVSHGQTVYYVITDVSDGNLAAKLGVNKSAKLANAAHTTEHELRRPRRLLLRSSRRECLATFRSALAGGRRRER